MSEGLGPISFPEEDRNSREFGRRPYSKRLANTMDDEARNIIAKAYKRTEGILVQHRDMLEKVSTFPHHPSLSCPNFFLLSQMAEALLLKETLNYADVEALIGPPPHGQKHLIEPLQFEAEISEQAGIPPGRSQQQFPPTSDD